MRRVIVRQTEKQLASGGNERLIELLATGLQRLFEKGGARIAVDFRADESVTTTCPDERASEDRAT